MKSLSSCICGGKTPCPPTSDAGEKRSSASGLAQPSWAGRGTSPAGQCCHRTGPRTGPQAQSRPPGASSAHPLGLFSSWELLSAVCLAHPAPQKAHLKGVSYGFPGLGWWWPSLCPHHLVHPLSSGSASRASRGSCIALVPRTWLREAHLSARLWVDLATWGGAGMSCRYALLLHDRHSHLSSAGETSGGGSGSGSLLRLLPAKPWLSQSELPGLQPRCCDPRREPQRKPGTFHP